MGYRSVVPSGGHLVGTVEQIWRSQVTDAHGEQTVLPTGRAQLIFGLDPEHPVALLQGPTTRPTRVDSAPQRMAVGVAFRPGGLRAFTGEPASSFTDRHVDIGEVFAVDAAALLDELRDCFLSGTVAQRLGRLVSSQLEVVRHPPPDTVRHAVGLLDSGVTVSETCVHLGEDRRKLTSAFRTELGIAPKLFSRLRRFEAAIGRVRRADAAGLAPIAAELGFADQAHMTREFAEFAGMSPGVLHRDASPAPTHLAA